MRILPSPALLLVFLLISPVACRQDEEAGEGATLGGIQRSILDRSCVAQGCHFGPGTESRLDLVSGRSHVALVGVRSAQRHDMLLVEPGRPDRSDLIRKLEGRDIEGERMPQGREPLTEEEIDRVRRWIERGAPDD